MPQDWIQYGIAFALAAMAIVTGRARIWVWGEELKSGQAEFTRALAAKDAELARLQTLHETQLARIERDHGAELARAEARRAETWELLKRSLKAIERIGDATEKTATAAGVLASDRSSTR